MKVQSREIIAIERLRGGVIDQALRLNGSYADPTIERLRVTSIQINHDITVSVRE